MRSLKQVVKRIARETRADTKGVSVKTLQRRERERGLLDHED